MPADKGTGEFEKSFMNIGVSFKSRTQTTKTVEPGVRTFDNPEKFAKAAAMDSSERAITGLMRLGAALWVCTTTSVLAIPIRGASSALEKSSVVWPYRGQRVSVKFMTNQVASGKSHILVPGRKTFSKVQKRARAGASILEVIRTQLSSNIICPQPQSRSFSLI